MVVFLECIVAERVLSAGCGRDDDRNLILPAVDELRDCIG
jgi:hypothetical protein